jgi:hypothetical protein
MPLASTESSQPQLTAPSELVKAQQTTSATDTQPVLPESSLFNPAAPATIATTCVPSDGFKEVNLNPSESKHSTLPSKASMRHHDLTGHCINYIPKQYSANSNTKCSRTVELNPGCLQEAIGVLKYIALETNTLVNSKVKAASFQQLDFQEANAITTSNRTGSPPISAIANHYLDFQQEQDFPIWTNIMIPQASFQDFRYFDLFGLA